MFKESAWTLDKNVIFCVILLRYKACNKLHVTIKKHLMYIFTRIISKWVKGFGMMIRKSFFLVPDI